MDCQFFRQVVFVFYKYVKQTICSSVSLRVPKSFVSCFQKRKYDTESTQMQTIYEYKYDLREKYSYFKISCQNEGFDNDSYSFARYIICQCR